MRIFFVAVIIIFKIQSWSIADDIKEFEIEGMSIGDSLLKFMNKKIEKMIYNIIQVTANSIQFHTLEIYKIMMLLKLC